MLLRVELATGRVTGASLHLGGQAAEGGIHFAGESRLDNRSELCRRLRLPLDVSDAELIVQAYLAFGEAHPEYLLGDFAYALYDARRSRLLLVRDHMGVVPLYYHLREDLCVASSSLDALLNQPGLPRELDDGVVAEWCVNGHLLNQIDTFFAAIKKVPRATQLCIGAQSRQAMTYWSLAEIGPLADVREPALVEQLHDLLQTAILDRLDENGGQAAHSSGGLDSTPIAIIAGRACRRQGHDFRTYNWCRPEAGDDRDCHEWTDARRVAQAEGFLHHEIAVTPETFRRELLLHDLARDGTTMFTYERQVLQLARSDRVTRIFSGFGGDEILTTRSRDRHLQALRSGRFLHVFRRMAMESDPKQLGLLPRLCWRFARGLKQSWLPTAPARDPWRLEVARRAEARLNLLKPDFADFARSRIYELGGLSLADRIAERQADGISVGYHQERMESWAILGGRYGVRHVYPYLDKRIVEFALALPAEWYFRHGDGRYLYRRALGDSLPDPLRGKAKPPESERVRQLIQNRHAALLHPELAARVAATASPYVDAQRLLKKLEGLKQTDPSRCQDNWLDVSTAFNAILALGLGGVPKI